MLILGSALLMDALS